MGKLLKGGAQRLRTEMAEHFHSVHGSDSKSGETSICPLKKALTSLCCLIADAVLVIQTLKHVQLTHAICNDAALSMSMLFLR